ncbi:MAG: putative metal-dependent amidase/aminoacylase/carboxypeptidase [Blastococcus sp.]|jgi:hippurate hydrolase|nr:putative metal-dependent amidase/aminoacylase/carboxypeptidase [Blastococcus sp.]
MAVIDDAAAMREYLTELRHDLHREPEIGLVLPRTQEKVLRALDGLPLEISVGERTTSVTAILRGSAPTRAAVDPPVVLIRGDMDGLPVQEAVDVPFRSRIDGAMHACGHDLHTAMLAGAAHLLSARREQLAGDVVFMFQPGEESWDGARVMIEEGVLTAAGPRPQAAFGMHVFSGLVDHGQFFIRPGPMLAASDQLHVTVQGQGGHGSAPHLALDPVPVLAEMIMSLQSMVTRQFDIFDPVVVTVGLVQAGTKANIIPDTATFQATIRTFSAASRERMSVAAPRLICALAEGHGMEAKVDYVPGYPVTLNDVDETAFATTIAGELFGDVRNEYLLNPLAGAEDFSRILQEVPGSFMGLGAAPPGVDLASAPFNHSPYAAYDDGVLSDGAALYAEWAARRLELADAPALRGRRPGEAQR